MNGRFVIARIFYHISKHLPKPRMVHLVYTQIPLAGGICQHQITGQKGLQSILHHSGQRLRHAHKGFRSRVQRVPSHQCRHAHHHHFGVVRKALDICSDFQGGNHMPQILGHWLAAGN